MKCHYEILGVERDADDKAIKNGTKFHQANSAKKKE